ncbi:ACSF2 family protein [Megaselia abdita]
MEFNPELSYIHEIGQKPLVYRNIGQQFDIAVKRFPNVEAIVSCHENIRLTYTQLRDQADRLGAAFIKLGLKSGDVIAVWGPNTINWYLTMLAAARTGLLLLGMNPAFQGQEIRNCLQKVDAKAIIITPESFKKQHYFKILKAVIPEMEKASPGLLKSKSIPTLRHIIVDSQQKHRSVWKFDDLMQWAENSDIQTVKNSVHKVSPDSPCNIQLTSGTTGVPKAVVLSHFNVVNNSIEFGTRIPMNELKLCCQIPFFHAYALICALFPAYEYGSTLVLPSEGFDADCSLNAIHNEKCVVIYGTPTMYVDLINKQKILNVPMGIAKYAVTAGAPCSPQLFEDIKSILKLEKVNTLYGLSETTAGIFISMPDESKDNVLNTVGRVLQHQEVRVVDSDGFLVPFGSPGELHVRSYRNMMCYYGDEERTRDMITKSGWLRTGDQFILMKDGYGIIVGRLKDLIIRGGENIYPKEIEDFLNTHPDVLEAFVVGIPDDRMGEELCAFIRIPEGIEVDEVKLKQFCVGKIAHFKIPKYIRVVKEFPKTATGKIQKHKLKELFLL